MLPANQDTFSLPLITEDEAQAGASTGSSRRDWVMRELALLDPEKHPLPLPDDPPATGE
jgi:hypothetical protein